MPLLSKVTAAGECGQFGGVMHGTGVDDASMGTHIAACV